MARPQKFRPPLLPAALAAGAYLAYWLLLGLGGDYLYSTSAIPLLYVEDILSGKSKAGAPKTLIFGDSTTNMSLAAEKLPETLSLAMFISSPMESYYSLQRYLERFPPPKCIVIGSSYAWEYQRKLGFFEVYVFHGFYGLRELNEIYETGAALADFPADTYSKLGFFWEAFLYRAHLRGIHPFSFQGGPFATLSFNKRSNDWTRAHLRDGRGTLQIDYWQYIHNAESLEHLRRPFSASPISDKYLERLLALAASHNVRVHWIQPPVSPGMLDGITRKFYADLAAHLSPYFLAIKGNTFDGTLLPFPAEFFANPVHVNSAGAERFTNEKRRLFNECR